MLEPKIIRLEPPVLEKTDLQKVYERQRDERIARIHLKVDQDIEYYNGKLDELIAETLQNIHSDHLPEDIKEIMLQGDKKWRTICANARKFKKYIKLDVDAFEMQMNAVVFNSDEILAAKDKFISSVQNANRNFFTQLWYRIKLFFQSFKF